MYNIEEKNYGYKITFAELISEDEMSEWVLDVENILNGKRENFGVLVDMRTLQPLSVEAIMQMHNGQKLFKSKGMVLSTVIYSNSISPAQFTPLSKKTCVYEWESYIITTLHKEWEKIGLDLTKKLPINNK